jgi:hypothetical protein
MILQSNCIQWKVLQNEVQLVTSSCCIAMLFEKHKLGLREKEKNLGKNWRQVQIITCDCF